MAELWVTSGLLSLSNGIPFGAFLPHLLLSSSRPEFKWRHWLRGPCSTSLLCFQFPVSLMKLELRFSFPDPITVGNGILIRKACYLSVYHWKPCLFCSVLIPNTQLWATDMLKEKRDEGSMQGHHGSGSGIKNLGVQVLVLCLGSCVAVASSFPSPVLLQIFKCGW